MSFTSQHYALIWLCKMKCCQLWPGQNMHTLFALFHQEPMKKPSVFSWAPGFTQIGNSAYLCSAYKFFIFKAQKVWSGSTRLLKFIIMNHYVVSSNPLNPFQAPPNVNVYFTQLLSSEVYIAIVIHYT